MSIHDGLLCSFIRSVTGNVRYFRRRGRTLSGVGVEIVDGGNRGVGLAFAYCEGLGF